MKSNRRALVLLASLLTLVACGDINDPATQDGQADASSLAREMASNRLNPDWLGAGLPPEAIPTTADQLVASFRTAHDQRDPELLDRLLSSDFRFIKRDGEAWDRAADYSIMTKMMVGRAGEGGFAIADMTIDHLIPLGTWQEVPTNDPYFSGFDGAMIRPYDARIDYAVAGQYLILQVRGLVFVCAQPTGSTYQLLGLVDHTEGRTESVTWTALKALFE